MLDFKKLKRWGAALNVSDSKQNSSNEKRLNHTAWFQWGGAMGHTVEGGIEVWSQRQQQ